MRADYFASLMATNLRHHVNASNDQMGLYVTSYFDALYEYVKGWRDMLVTW